mgnify:CR=1
MENYPKQIKIKLIKKINNYEFFNWKRF